VTVAAARHLLHSQGCRHENRPASTPVQRHWRPAKASWLLRRRAGRGPCDGARPGRRGRPWYASARGSRGPSPADGCSAGTCACSLELQIRFGKVQIRADHAGHHAARLGCIHPQTAAAAVTWLSLLTVKAIGAQVKPSRAAGPRRPFHQRDRAGAQPRKRRSARRLRPAHSQTAIRNTAISTTHPPLGT
jgi:hypothetical protein